MKERPILFSGPMVRAILAGTKTQTRRVVKDCGLWETQPGLTDLRPITADCPYGQPGDRLWVRETFCIETSQDVGYYPPPHNDGRPLREVEDPHGEWGTWWERPHYKATDPAPELAYPDDEGEPKVKWSPSIHMPRWASRLTLEITGVRVERLQDISDADALSEGVERLINEDGFIDYHHQWGKVIKAMDAASSFRSLWDSINAARGLGWDTNPWVWVITFNMVVP